ncbi:STAS domain-containing protein [Streptomyces sp. NPDC051105]|uniref:STAS domain-containing protein n=1 Tax=Streptomyces sp. NPDC051105 TaxID=3154843 RepID=UPI0034363E2C
MPLPQLTVYRHDRRKRALITLAGEIDLESAPLVRRALAQCLSDGIRIIDIDLIPVTFCDCSGLNTFLHAAQKSTEAGGTLRLHHPPPTLTLILDLTGSGFLLLGVPSGHLSPPPGGVPAPAAPATPSRRTGHIRLPLYSPVMRGDRPAGQGQTRKRHDSESSIVDAVRLRRVNRRQAQ